MNPTVTQHLQQRNPVSYAVTNGSGVIVEQVGDPMLLYGAPIAARGVGRRLVDVVPELATERDELLLLLHRAQRQEEASSLHFQWAHRDWWENPDGKRWYSEGLDAAPDRPEAEERRYVNLTVCSRWTAEGVAGLVCLAEEVTAQARMRQELMQQRNELSLLQQQLLEQNQELRAANVELRLMNDTQSSFYSLAAHKLRNPLTSIYGYLEMMLEELDYLDRQEQRMGLETVQQNARRLLNEVTNLVNAARIDADRMELVLRPTPVDVLLRNAVTFAQLPFEIKGQVLQQEIGLNMPLLLCDAKRAAEAIGHLLNNGSKFSPRGAEIVLAVQLMPDGDFVRISVSDSGEGVSRSAKEEIFASPHQVQRTFHSRTRETGLGLYIARSLTELHGGSVWYESEPGEGSTFHMTLPVMETADEADAGQRVPALREAVGAQPGGE